MRLLLLTGLALFALTNCQRAPEPTQGEEDGHDHGHGAKAAGGASFKKGQGVLVREDTKKLLGLETAEIGRKPVVPKVEFIVQAFPDGQAGDPASWRASGPVPTTLLAGVKTGHEVALRTDDGAIFSGKVKTLDNTLGRTRGETDVLVEFVGPTLPPTSVIFLHATLTLPALVSSMVVPRSALLRTAEGAFVYAVNGDAYQRTAVKTGAEGDGLVEINDGLLEGDIVVIRPVEALYLVELRAVKGGGHSH